jgi:hypothetical protein
MDLPVGANPVKGQSIKQEEPKGKNPVVGRDKGIKGKGMGELPAHQTYGLPEGKGLWR